MRKCLRIKLKIMRQLYKLFVIIVTALMHTLSLNAQDETPHWHCNVHAFEYEMTVYFNLNKDDSLVPDINEYEIAAFYDAECRGVSEVISIGDTSVGYIRLRSNHASGETISFKAFCKTSNKEYDIDETISFKSEDLLGMPSSPKELHITIYPITITAKNAKKIYGDKNPELNYEVEGVDLSGTPSLSCDATEMSPVGSYPIVVSIGSITNKNVTLINGLLTITRAPLTIGVGEYTREQGEDNPNFTITYNGFKNDENHNILTSQPIVYCEATKDSGPGEYAITISGASATNYDISYVAGKLTIKAVESSQPDAPSSPDSPAATEPSGTTFDEDVDESSKEVKVTFVVMESNGSDTPTVAISDDKDASGNVSIPESVTHNGVEYKVTEISAGAFQNNTGLTEVLIPASITSIGANAFAGCTNLKSITVYNSTPINLSVISARGLTRTESSSSVFEGVNKETCILYVPEGSVDAYKVAPVWKDFKNILPIGSGTGIKGIEMTEGETFDVFNLYGLKVKSKATSLDGLPRGIYVVKGKKVIK